MHDEYHNKEYASNAKANTGVTLGAVGTGLGAIPIVGKVMESLAGGCGGQKTQLEIELAYEKGKNYTDQTVIQALRDGEAQRIAITQQVVANKEELAILKTKQACDEAHAREIAELREANMRLTIKDAVESAVSPIKTDIVRLRDGELALRQELVGAIQLEAERRCCADNKIVAYTNATFAPKTITGYTADATSATLAPIGNPLCGCCNGGGFAPAA